MLPLILPCTRVAIWIEPYRSQYDIVEHFSGVARIPHILFQVGVSQAMAGSENHLSFSFSCLQWPTVSWGCGFLSRRATLRSTLAGKADQTFNGGSTSEPADRLSQRPYGFSVFNSFSTMVLTKTTTNPWVITRYALSTSQSRFNFLSHTIIWVYCQHFVVLFLPIMVDKIWVWTKLTIWPDRTSWHS